MVVEISLDTPETYSAGQKKREKKEEEKERKKVQLTVVLANKRLSTTVTTAEHTRKCVQVVMKVHVCVFSRYRKRVKFQVGPGSQAMCSVRRFAQRNRCSPVGTKTIKCQISFFMSQWISRLKFKLKQISKADADQLFATLKVIVNFTKQQLKANGVQTKEVRIVQNPIDGRRTKALEILSKPIKGVKSI